MCLRQASSRVESGEEAQVRSICRSARLPAVKCCPPGGPQWCRACKLQSHDCACCGARPTDFLETARGRVSIYVNDSYRRILCTSASSAQSEPDFSAVGHTVTDMRSRLSADKVEAVELVRAGIRLGLFLIYLFTDSHCDVYVLSWRLHVWQFIVV